MIGDDSQGGREDGRERFWDLSRAVVGACIEVHRHCGPGLLESVYERCLAHELALRRIPFVRQHAIALAYKGLDIPDAYRADFLIAGNLVVELKAVERVMPVHFAQLLSYLKLARVDVGLLVNFNAPYLRDGVRRFMRRPGANRYAQAFVATPWPDEV